MLVLIYKNNLDHLLTIEQKKQAFRNENDKMTR